MSIKFKNYLINENNVLLSQKIGDILNALQTFSEDPKNIDKRNKAENIVNQIRRILHTKWNSNQKNNLYTLRKIAANILMSVDPKKQNRPDLDKVVLASIKSLEDILNNLEKPII